MSIYGSIGYTRRDHYRERVLTHKAKRELELLETELRNVQNEHTSLWENYDLTDEEVKELEKPLQIKIDDLINRVCAIKYEKVW